MQPNAGFASDEDWAMAVSGFAAAGQQQQQQQQVGVLQACQRAAAAHRLFQQRLLPKLQVKMDSPAEWIQQNIHVFLLHCVLRTSKKRLCIHEVA